MTRPLRLARVVTTSVTFSTLLYEQIAAIRDAGIQLTLVSSEEEQLSQIAASQGVAYNAIPMARQPNVTQDVRSLLSLQSFFRTHQFDIVHSSTPKAGLLTAVAGLVSGIPIRLHTFTGQRWATSSGAQRHLLRAFDHLVGSLSTFSYADSASQRQFLVDEHIVQPGKIRVLGSGSISGVNLARFDAGKWGGQLRVATRAALGIPPDALVVAFVGRVTRDKGIVELTKAFTELSTRHPGLYLLLVGPFEPDLDPLPVETETTIKTDCRIRSTGFCSDPERYLGGADIFCLPSYREGFGSVVIEAAAMGLPSVATSIVGLTDAVEDGKTGLLIPPKDTRALVAALEVLITQPVLRTHMGASARERARTAFASETVNQAVVAEYRSLAMHHLRHNTV